jgi:hypothetical protein
VNVCGRLKITQGDPHESSPSISNSVCGAKGIIILSGAVTGTRGLSSNVNLRGTSGLRIDVYNEEPVDYGCEPCEAGTSIHVDARLMSIFGTARLHGRDYPLNANFGPSYANLFLTGGTVIVPPLSGETARASAPFTLGEGTELVITDPAGTSNHYALSGSGTATLTFNRNAFTPSVWSITSEVYTFQKRNE